MQEFNTVEDVIALAGPAVLAELVRYADLIIKDLHAQKVALLDVVDRLTGEVEWLCGEVDHYGIIASYAEQVMGVDLDELRADALSWHHNGVWDSEESAWNITPEMSHHWDDAPF